MTSGLVRQMLPTFSFRMPQCERGLQALCSYRTMRETSTGLAREGQSYDPAKICPQPS